MEADGQPEVMAAQKGSAEEDSKGHGVSDTQLRCIRVAGVKQAEENACGEDGRKSSEAFEQYLKSKTMEEKFFADGAAYEKDRNEQDCAPVGARVQLSRDKAREAGQYGKTEH